MNGLYGIARVCAGLLGFTALIGVAWFSAFLGSTEFASGLILGLTSLAAAFTPQRKLSIGKVRQTLFLLCLVGVSGGVVLLSHNLGAPHPVELDVVAINLLNLGALVVIAIRAWTWSSQQEHQ